MTRTLGLKPWVCSFDLETTNLYGNFMGVILVGCVKPWGKPVKVFRGDKYKNWKQKRSDDSKICSDIYEELKQYRIWVAHNGLAFDINFLRTRLHKHGIKMDQPRNVDPVRIARRYLRFKFNSLDAVGEHFGFRDYKTKVDQSIWNEAALDGSKRAMDYITHHCVKDCELLELVTNEIDYLIPKVTKWGSDV